MTQGSIPSLYEWAGGAPAFERLTEIFYRRVEDEPLLAGLFAKSEPSRATYVAQFIGEVFGGPKRYREDRRGHANMIVPSLDCSPLRCAVYARRCSFDA